VEGVLECRTFRNGGRGEKKAKGFKLAGRTESKTHPLRSKTEAEKGVRGGRYTGCANRDLGVKL